MREEKHDDRLRHPTAVDNVCDTVRGEAQREEAQHRALPALPPGRHQHTIRPAECRCHQPSVRHPPLGRRVRVAQGLQSGRGRRTQTHQGGRRFRSKTSSFQK